MSGVETCEGQVEGGRRTAGHDEHGAWHQRPGGVASCTLTLSCQTCLQSSPSDISSSSRRLRPISCEGAFVLSVGVGNSGKEGGDCGDVSNPDRSSSAVLLLPV